MNLDTAAGKANVSTEKLEEWERGASQPTIRQAELLAKAYHRPFALLFLPDPPTDFLPLQDFRRKTAHPLGTASIFIIREIQQKQAWAHEFYEESGEKPLPFVGRFSLHDHPRVVAENMLAELGIDPSSYRTDNPIREWIERAEAKGIFISRTSFINSSLKLDSDEMQGFVIADPLAPFVFLNTDDWNAPQLFTLVHELAHIWISQSGISNEIQPDTSVRDQLNPVELFCNEVASQALMPASVMDKLYNDSFLSAEATYAAARQFGVSSFAFLVRALDLQKITLSQYRQLKKHADQAFHAYMTKEEEKKLKMKAKEDGPSAYMLRTIRNGYLFTRFVMDAFRGGFIEPTQASSLLNTSINKFSKLEAYV